jgi:hypothetical protein
MALAQEAQTSLSWLGQSGERPLLELRRELGGRRDAQWSALIDAMIQSQRIYQPFTGGVGERTLANIERETLLKMNFLGRYRAAERQSLDPPRVMLKFGAYHMYRGPTPTFALGLGGFVSELAVQNGAGSLAILAVCGPAGSLAQLFGPPAPCRESFEANWSFLAPFMEADQLTIIDLRVWKLRPRRWAHLPADMVRLIASYDILVVFPNTPASSLLPGLAPLQPPG